jgi:hypothetical protein
MGDDKGRHVSAPRLASLASSLCLYRGRRELDLDGLGFALVSRQCGDMVGMAALDVGRDLSGIVDVAPPRRRAGRASREAYTPACRSTSRSRRRSARWSTAPWSVCLNPSPSDGSSTIVTPVRLGGSAGDWRTHEAKGRRKGSRKGAAKRVAEGVAEGQPKRWQEGRVPAEWTGFTLAQAGMGLTPTSGQPSRGSRPSTGAATDLTGCSKGKDGTPRFRTHLSGYDPPGTRQSAPVPRPDRFSLIAIPQISSVRTTCLFSSTNRDSNRVEDSIRCPVGRDQGYEPTELAFQHEGYETLVGVDFVSREGIQTLVDTTVKLLQELYR